MKGSMPKELQKFTEGPKEEKKSFTPRETKDLKTWCLRLEAVAQNISGDSSLRVHQGEPNTQLWYYNTIRNEAFFDPSEVLERQEDQEEVLLGSIAHEAGHAIISDFTFIPKSASKQLGFTSLMRAVEERPTDQVVRDRFPGAGKWVDKMREVLAEEGAIQGPIKDRIGYVPYFSQLLSMIVFERVYSDEITATQDEEVLHKYQQIKKTVEQIEKMFPNQQSDTSTKKDFAIKRYKKTYKQLFPELKKLVEIDKEREQLRQMAIALLADDMEKNKPQNTSTEPKILKKLSTELQDEMFSKIIPCLRKRSETWIQSLGDQEDASILPTMKTNDSTSRKLELIHALTIQNNFEAYKLIPVPVDKFSQELQHALKALIEEQEQEEQEEEQERNETSKNQSIQEQAQKVLEQIEDMINETLKGMMEKESLPTHKEIAKQEEEQELTEKLEKSRQENEQRIESIRKEIEQNMSEVLKKSTYDEFYEQVREQDEALYNELYEIFYPSKKQKKQLKTTGSQLNIRALFNFISARKAGAKDIPAKIWEAKTTPEVRDYAFMILIDLSGSMQRTDYYNSISPIKESLKALIAVSESLNRLGIKLEIVGFGSIENYDDQGLYRDENEEIITLKSIEDEMTDEIREKLTTVLNADGTTPTTKALKHAKDRMNSIQAANKFITVLTDGAPDYFSDAKEQAEIIESTPDIGLLGLGIGSNTRRIEDLFSHSKGEIKIDELTDVLTELIVELIKNPTSTKTRD